MVYLKALPDGEAYYYPEIRAVLDMISIHRYICRLVTLNVADGKRMPAFGRCMTLETCQPASPKSMLAANKIVRRYRFLAHDSFVNRL